HPFLFWLALAFMICVVLVIVSRRNLSPDESDEPDLTDVSEKAPQTSTTTAQGDGEPPNADIDPSKYF
ncbi:MAG: hypothetical protein NTZ50_11055, partial [Chloroflexi bacterium]|nr:hypothetical protein [Chloroflexota bacterium]